MEEILDAGRPFNYGLEDGSKPEMFAGLAIHNDPEALLVCNGYKDNAFIRMALLGRKLSRHSSDLMTELSGIGGHRRAATEERQVFGGQS